MNSKYKRFAEEYIRDLNATQACIRSGYSEATARSQGQRLLTNVDIQEEIQRLKIQRSERTKIEADRVLIELGTIAFSNILDYVTITSNSVTFKEIPKDKARAIAEISTTETKYGKTIKFKLHDKLGALEKIARHLGMFEETKPEEEELDLSKLTTEELKYHCYILQKAKPDPK